MYKIVAEVVKVSDPKTIEGEDLHVRWPCPVYKVGDRMTFTIFPATMMVMEETDKVCLSALSAIMPLIRGLIQGKAEDWDFIDKVTYYSCPDAERPVIFKLIRVPVEPPIPGKTKYGDAQKEICSS
ncbi:MAG: TIGR04076 family protein [Burkholderiales bacterium]|nr:TIGR04076 family protein [Burkholderiales bacterium]